MLYGAVTMGSCYLVAAICLKQAEVDPLRKRLVCPLDIPLSLSLFQYQLPSPR